MPHTVPSIDDLDALLLDLDGTLVDTEPIHLALHREVLEPLGVVIDQAAIERNVGTNDDVAFYTRMLSQYDVQADAPSLVATKDARTWRHLEEDDIPTKPGLEALLRAIADRDLPFAVVTATKRAPAELIMRRCGIYPQELICFEEVRRAKPDPQPYQIALDRLGVEAASCLAVEDSRVGIASAVAAKLPTIAMAGLIPADQQIELGARQVITDFREWLP